MKNLNCVIDISTKAILTFTKSYSCAVAVSQGLINTEPHIIPTSITKIANHVKRFDLVNDNLCSTKDDWMMSLPKHLITADYNKRRKLATTRATYIHSLEAHLDSVVSRGVLNFDEMVVPYLLEQHSRCDPERNSYSYGIVEYANIQNIDVKTAYDEIGVMLNTAGLIKIRAFSWMQNCVRKINSTEDLTMLSKIWKECWEDVKRCAFT